MNCVQLYAINWLNVHELRTVVRCYLNVICVQLYAIDWTWIAYSCTLSTGIVYSCTQATSHCADSLISCNWLSARPLYLVLNFSIQLNSCFSKYSLSFAPSPKKRRKFLCNFIYYANQLRISVLRIKTSSAALCGILRTKELYFFYIKSLCIPY